ncbi:hypothetical protein [Francisella sp. SYW-9]|nr:hypothetical protein [Francisella sp. SYW-9]
MKKAIFSILILLSLNSAGYSYGLANQVSSDSFPPPIMELA